MDSLGLVPVCIHNFMIDHGVRKTREPIESKYAEIRWFEFEWTGVDVGNSGDRKGWDRAGRHRSSRTSTSLSIFTGCSSSFFARIFYEVGKKWELWSQLCTETVPTQCGGFKTKVWTKRVKRDAGEAYRNLIETNYFTRRKRINNENPPGFGLP